MLIDDDDDNDNDDDDYIDTILNKSKISNYKIYPYLFLIYAIRHYTIYTHTKKHTHTKLTYYDTCN